MKAHRPRIEALLDEAIGLDVGSVGADRVEGAVRRRMRALELDEPRAYLDLVERRPDELEALIDQVAVPESWFFREEGAFEYLVAWAFGEWRPRHGGRPLRALSLACAAGEEPYSIAISLVEAGFDELEVLGIDVRRAAVEQAQRALYPKAALRGERPGLVARHFEASGEGLRLVSPASRLVRFAHGNALDPTLLAEVPPFDVVFCRNLLIYLSATGRERLRATVRRLLADDGLLFAGHAEAEGAWGEPFASLRQPRAFAFRRSPLRQPEQRPARRRVVKKPTSRARRRRDPGAATKPAAVARRRRPAVESDLEEARRLADDGLLGDASLLCERHLAESGPSAGALYLLGIVRQAAGDATAAEALYRKAIYLDPGNQRALLALALCLEGRGEAAEARLIRRRIERSALGDEGATRGERGRANQR